MKYMKKRGRRKRKQEEFVSLEMNFMIALKSKKKRAKKKVHSKTPIRK